MNIKDVILSVSAATSLIASVAAVVIALCFSNPKCRATSAKNGEPAMVLIINPNLGLKFENDQSVTWMKIDPPYQPKINVTPNPILTKKK